MTRRQRRWQAVVYQRRKPATTAHRVGAVSSRHPTITAAHKAPYRRLAVTELKAVAGNAVWP